MRHVRTRTRLVTALLTLATLAAAPASAGADPRCECGWCQRRPYGASSSDSGGYGAKEPVQTADEARKRLEAYFDGDDLVVGKIEERELYFEASVKHADGRLVDRVIIDKRSGRIRSTL
jgi:hypothetical protein